MTLRKAFFLALGFAILIAVHIAEAPPDAVDPAGKAIPLTREGKTAIGLFLLAAIWWVFEALPIGVTGISIGVLQVLLQIRPAKAAFGDFMDPAVWFIFGSLILGIAFNKTGLTRRLAFGIVRVAGDSTRRIYLGVFVITALLAHVMAHTAAAATVFPALVAIYSFYGEPGRPTRFGKGLFIGMAFAAGAGSIVTLLGSARSVMGLELFRTVTEREVGFLEVSWYLAPIGWATVFLIWRLMLVLYPPEQETIPNLRAEAARLHAALGSLKRQELLVIFATVWVLLALAAQALIPPMEPLNRSALLLLSTLFLFMTGVLTAGDLDAIPWNIILLFGGAMSIGFCLWETGAAQWLAVTWLGLFQGAHWVAFLLALALLVLLATNLLMNVAALSISLPVALVTARYFGIAPDVVLFIVLVAAGMPFLTLVGGAPNAIAHGSGQFTAREFAAAGVPASLAVLGIIALAMLVLWPLMGMPILLAK
jgi:sodium-dependent dicarboxylate transporter 2/3/5